MSEDPKWKTGTATGPNDKLVSLAEKIAQLGKLAIQEKLDQMKRHVNVEVQKNGGHPILKEFAEHVNKIRVD